MFTVGQLRPSLSQFVRENGVCADDPSVLEWTNSARRIMYPRGDWKNTVETLLVCPFDGYLTLPYDYETAIEAFHSNAPIVIENGWFQVYDADGRFRSGSCSLIDLGDKFATFRDYFVNRRPATHRLFTFSELDEDNGKQITFNATGEHKDRMQVTLILGPAWQRVSIPEWIWNYRQVVKNPTNGRVRVYIYDPNRGTEELCAIYEADDVNPHYRRYAVGVSRRNVEVLAKKRYRPLVNENDPVEFPEDSLVLAFQALSAREAKNHAEYTEKLNLALEVLQQELGDRESRVATPIKRTCVDVVTNL